MTTTWQQLVDRTQIQIGDSGAAVWTEAVVIDWLKDAIRDYSLHFPRRVAYLFTANTSTEYSDDLDPGTREIITVEHPTGESPPRYLKQLAHTHPDFYNGDYYDYTHLGTEADPLASVWLWLSNPQDGEDVEVWALADQATSYTVLGDNIGIPEKHQPILMQFVYWKATLELLAQEQQAPTSNSSLLMSQINQNARDAKNRYDGMIRNALASTESRSRFVNWQGYDTGRVY